MINKTNRIGFELYAIVIELEFVTIPISYLLLDMRKCKVNEKCSLHLTQWLCALCDNGFKLKYFFTDKDFAEVNAIQSTYPDSTMQPKLCLWHALQAIKKHVLVTSYTKTQKEVL